MDAKIQYNNHIKELAANSESALRRQQIDNDFLTDTITMNIPDELSFKILEYAVEEHDYKDDALWFNGSFSDYRWTISKRVTDGIEGNVARISDRRALHQEQMVRSMQNKLAVLSTCKHWNVLATELMYQTIAVKNKASLVAILDRLESNSQRGKWAKGLFLCQSLFDHCTNRNDVGQLLTRLVRLCPNLRAVVLHPVRELHIMLGENPELFNAIHDLATLKFLSWYMYIPFTANISTPAAFSKMSELSSLHIEISAYHSDGYVDADLPSLPSLEVLSLSAVTKSSLAYISSWLMPNLTRLEIDFKFEETTDGLLQLLRLCGVRLLTLSILAYCLHSIVDIHSVLALCPSLTTFSCNVDFGVQDHIVFSPHQNLSRIGLYSNTFLLFFKQEEMVFTSLFRNLPKVTYNLSILNKHNFPLLSSIRFLSGHVLTDYLRRGGMDALDVAKSAVWIELCQRCTKEGIRLEDVTGCEFGTRPSFGGVQGPLKYA